MDKKRSRKRRAVKTRAKISQLKIVRLCVHRTLHHIYAQVVLPGGKVIASASTLDKIIRGEVGNNGGNMAAATIVGKCIAERAQEAGVTKVAFDRSGFKYHGRVQALAKAAREHGLEF